MSDNFKSLSLSLRNNYQGGGQAGLNLFATPRSPEGGLRRSEVIPQMLIDLRGDSRG